MKMNLKRILSLFLAVLLTFAVIQMEGFAADDDTEVQGAVKNMSKLAHAYADRITMIHDHRLLVNVKRDDRDYEERLAAGLRQIYGREVCPRFLDGALVLRWQGT